MWLPPMTTVFFGFRACTWKVAGTFLICSSMKARSKRTRFSSIFNPARRKRSRALTCKKSTPISCRISMAWSSTCCPCSAERMSYGLSVLVHIPSGAGVSQRPGDLAVAARLEGAGVDPLVILGIDVPRVADALRIGRGFLGEHGYLLLGKAELVERWDVEVLGQLVNVFDPDLGRLPNRFVDDLEPQRLADPGEALGLAGVVVLHHRGEQPAGQRAVRGVVHAARGLAHRMGRAGGIRAIGK